MNREETRMNRAKPTQRGLWVAIFFAIVVSSVSFLNGYLNERDAKDQAVATAVDQQDQKKAVVSDAEVLVQQATAACAEATGATLTTLQDAGLCRQADKTADTIEKATDNDTKTPPVTGPSQAQVNAAVGQFLSGRNVTGPTGPAGPGPSMEQLAAAIVAYCAPRDQCRGLTGTAGAAGTDGKSGAAGEKGDTPSDETLLSLVRRVFAENPPAAGANAPKVTAVDCADDGTLSFAFEDGSTLTATGSCRPPALLPDPPE